jgi:hypothetical protein
LRKWIMDDWLMADVRQNHVAAGRARKHHASEHGSEKKPAGQQATRHRLDNESNPAPLLANTARA